MKILIPIAGKGVRLYPHTLCTPKSFISIVGKSILKRLLDELFELIKYFSVKEIIFIIRPNEQKNKIEENLKKLTYDMGISYTIYYQEIPLGTADAILKAKESLVGPIIIVFSDSLFHKISFKKKIHKFSENIIWTKKVSDPHSFGVVKCNSYGKIINFIEKPKYFISDLAIVGLYYFNSGLTLKKELQYLIDNDIKNNKEYQLTSVLENMRKKGENFINQPVKDWMDFGDKKNTISSNSKILSIEYKNNSKLIHKKTILKNSIILNPCYIEEYSTIENSIIGPYVSIGKFTKIKNTNIKTSLVQNYTNIMYSNLKNSIIGNYVNYKELEKEINLGDYSTIV
ncbi:sugar phosphate nucleotidyltransferase [Blattabacterium cuenoti]|uniref:sugar phosphate nucleotidyltransferase n=1 Tax=Blattabacterium cuenoti TaxID=1653831 RepID=UPI00163D3B87|nr:sugar phosphate nucleotidyltransferase [Blattabacterium cuenoti]